MKAFCFLFLFIITLNCRHNEVIETDEELPYPPINEQRAGMNANTQVASIRILDSLQIMTDLQYLASDICEGRQPGTGGHEKSLEMILARMRSAGVDSFNNSLIQSFSGKSINGFTGGKNCVGWIKGTSFPKKYIVVTAHYDHLGKTTNGLIYNGADDNASGVACLLALASYFKQNPHPYTLIFVAFDREETGLEGAFNFVHHYRQSGEITNIKFNLNLDMIARSDKNEIFACGIKHYPSFRYIIEEVQKKINVSLLMGHDDSNQGGNWTYQSDHSAFHERGIPFLYIGVEDHNDYHTTNDKLNNINFSSFLENCNMVALIVQALRP
jgi:hypothetical protein